MAMQLSFVLSQISQSCQHLATRIMAFTYVHNDGTEKRVLTTPPLNETKWVIVQHTSRQVPSIQDARQSETLEVNPSSRKHCASAVDNASGSQTVNATTTTCISCFVDLQEVMQCHFCGAKTQGLVRYMLQASTSRI